jgi:hypothetical protein
MVGGMLTQHIQHSEPIIRLDMDIQKDNLRLRCQHFDTGDEICTVFEGDKGLPQSFHHDLHNFAAEGVILNIEKCLFHRCLPSNLHRLSQGRGCNG